MALFSIAGTFTQQAGTGNQVISGLGNQGKAIVFSVIESLTADGSSTTRVGRTIGMATSSTSRATVGGSANNDLNSAVRADNTKCITILDNTMALSADADFVSFGADGFTINWTTNDSIARTIQYFLVGGSDITNATVFEFISPGATGEQDYTGVGFQPDFILPIPAWDVEPPTTLGSFQTTGLGFASSATTEVSNIAATYAVTPEQESLQIDTWIVANAFGTGGGGLEGATLVSFDADGFTLDWLTNKAWYHWALCLKGGSYKTGTFNQRTSAGVQAVTGVGFLPSGLILTSVNQVQSDLLNSNTARHSLGFASGTSNRVCGWSGASSTDFNSNLVSNRAIQHLTEGTPTLNASADFQSFDSDGFTLSWTDADATARQILYAAFGSTTAPPAFAPENFPHQLVIGPRRRLVEVIPT